MTSVRRRRRRASDELIAIECVPVRAGSHVRARVLEIEIIDWSRARTRVRSKTRSQKTNPVEPIQQTRPRPERTARVSDNLFVLCCALHNYKQQLISTQCHKLRLCARAQCECVCV